jgi:hypothetical protein
LNVENCNNNKQIEKKRQGRVGWEEKSRQEVR